jgi:DNA invertase Pin-like site-specific DNA recombinase
MNNLALSSSQRSKLNKVEDKEFRVGIYVRNSDEKQDKEEGTIKNQRLRLSEWVDTRNKNKFDQFYGEVAEIYEDRSLSAKDMNRPMLKKLLRDVQKGKINLILVNELSRISRNTKDFNEIWHFLKQHDCKFVSL